MRAMMWIYVAIILWLSEAWSLEPGTNQSTSVASSTSSPPKVYVIRNSSFNLERDAHLTCSDKTWNEMMYVIWKIHLKDKQCRISFSNYGQSENFCNDGKSLQNTSSAQSYLRIPNFSIHDVGVYKCESVFNGGSENYEINVDITVPPNISMWLEREDSRTVAVCKAEGGKPAATISWSHAGNSSSVETPVSHGLFTVESRLVLPEETDTENLSCVIRHPSWEGEKILVSEHKKGHFPWLRILAVVVITVFLAGLLFFAYKKLTTLRRCKQPDTSPPSKSPPTEDVEEVEPYASYVQRVNSIYNSSADLFT